MIKLLELFGGIGACTQAFKRLGIPFEVVDYVEIDKYAVQAYNAINDTNFEPQDICEWDKDLQVDFIMHGSPCQDFSVAGKQAGGDEGTGTRSSLMYETIRIVNKLKPKYVLWENVKNLLSKKHKHNFDNYVNIMSEEGYQSYYMVLNAKDYGVPQNRERVFTLSIRKDIDKGYEFPQKQELKLRLKDLLEKNVDEKYFLSDKMINFFTENEQKQIEKGNGFRFGVSDGNVVAKSVTTRAGSRMDDNFIKVIGEVDIKGHDCIKRVYDVEGIAPTLTDMQGGHRQPKILELEYPYIAASRGRNPDRPSDRTAGIPTEQRLEPNRFGVSNTITSVQKDNYVVEGRERIRKLTPKECWRLMNFDDECFDKAKASGISDSQLYKQARK